jgi:hypothetical protein
VKGKSCGIELYKEKKKFLKRLHTRNKLLAPIRFLVGKLRHAIFKLKKQRISIQQWRNATSNTYYCSICKEELIKYKKYMICANPECSNTYHFIDPLGSLK